jgi:hypothetical protein
MQRPLNRIQPVGPAEAYKTYQVASPLSTHFRPAACAEVDCEQCREGWRTVIDERTDLGMRQAAYIRSECRSVSLELAGGHHAVNGPRRYIEAREGPMTVFTFPPGQECFATHQVPLERPELYVVREGDWRGNPRGAAPRQHARAADWLEDFAEHQDQLATAHQRG